jgi:colanic acid/amylovoran biosynthesis glycosyltransferase
MTRNNAPVILERCNQFVGRTTNWLYDHLRFIPHYNPYVLCNTLQNRQEFPDMTAWRLDSETLARRIWRKVAPTRMFPPDASRLRRLVPHVLHSHFGDVGADDVALAEFLGVPWFTSFYGADVFQLGLLPEWREKYRPMFSRGALILALGPFMAEHIERMGCPRDKIRVHALGVDVQSLPVRKRVLSPGEPLRLLFAGVFREKKGVRYVVEAAALARKSGVSLELHLVAEATQKPGDMEVKQAVIDQIRRHRLEDVIIHHPLLKFQDLITLALDCHIFIAPSVTADDGDREGTPFVLQQMMATGMPVIATHHSDIPFLFGELQQLLVPERDPQALAERIIAYAANPGSIMSDGMALREQIQRHFDIRKCAARLAEFYDEFDSSPRKALSRGA